MNNGDSAIEKDLLDKIVDGLSSDPCLLAIVVICAVFYFLVRMTYAHVEKMERARTRQLMNIANNHNGDQE